MNEKFDTPPTWQAVGKQRDVIYVQPLSKQELLDRQRAKRADPAGVAVRLRPPALGCARGSYRPHHPSRARRAS